MKFIKSSKVPVIPMFISGKNSRKFHFFGKIHPVLRTVRLPLELTNKYNYCVRLVLGSAITPRMQEDFVNLKDFTSFLRANVYTMRENSEDNAQMPTVVEQTCTSVAEIAEQTDIEILINEVEILKNDGYLLFTSGNFSAFEAPSFKIPNVLKEICRLREYTFRLVGEGTNLETDTDHYDSHYHHLFIFDNKNKSVIGSYRLGFGEDIMRDQGVEGFYTYTLFEYHQKFNDILTRSIELGRSFIVPEYQKSIKTLLMLWQGILTVLLRNPQYQYLLGPVSMSNSYCDTSKILMMNYVKYHHFNSTYVKMIVARNGIGALAKPKFDVSFLKGVKDIRLVEKLIADVDLENDSLPILIKKYLSIGGEIISFNVDPAFSDCLDSLLLLDLSKVPQGILEMLNKNNVFDIDYERFTK